MTTTIQVDDETHELLKKLRSSTDAGSYNEVIQRMIREKWRKQSLFGVLGKKTNKWVLRGLRDEEDRI